MKKRKIIFLLLVILAGFLPSVCLYADIKIVFLPLFYSIGLTIFSVIITYVKKINSQNFALQKQETKLYASVLAGSTILFYIIGLLIIRK